MTLGAYRLLAGVGVVFALAMFVVAAVFVAQTPGAILGASSAPADQSESAGEDVTVTIPEGASAEQIGALLEEEGVIASGRQFQALVRLMGVGDQLSSGRYNLVSDMSAPTAVRNLLVSDAVPVRQVTFPEGIRVEEMAVIAEDAGYGLASEFLDAVEQAELPPGLAEHVPDDLPEGQRLQGYLFPDTYILPEESGVAELVELMIQTMDLRFSQALRDAAAEQGLNPHEALTLAAIVEREAVIPDERPLIAGVFYNRIEANDIIGADPTTQFAISLDPDSQRVHGYWKQGLTEEDLDNPSPYNTRRNAGLPPGPITNPSLASIEAVAAPVDTDYYYFVADAVAGDGSHRFAVTEGEHQTNIALYGSAE